MKWISISGNVDSNNTELLFHPRTGQGDKSKGGIPYAYVKSNAYFENGEIEFFNVTIKEPKSKCQLVLNHKQEQEIYIGLNLTHYPFGIGALKNNEFESASVAGTGGKLDIDRKYNLKTRVNGSIITLFVDDIEVCSTNLIVKNTQFAIFFEGKSKIEIDTIKIKQQRPSAFVVMQFSKEFDEIYTEVIKRVCEEFKLEINRADEFYTQGRIINDIVNSIRESTIIIADITLIIQMFIMRLDSLRA